MSHAWIRVWQVPCVVLVLTTTIGAEIVDLEPGKDNSLFEIDEEADPLVFLSSGKGDSLFSGRTRESFQNKPDLRRALIAFDFSAIPAGSIINNVTLTLQVTKVRTTSDTDTALHRNLTDWGEGESNSVVLGGGMGTTAELGDATWIHSVFPDQFWNSPGGDFDPSPSAVLPVGGTGAYSWNSQAMIADVQGWVDGTLDNFGWMVLVDQETLGDAKRFGSREHTDPNLVPRLTLDFVTPQIVTVDALKDNTLFETADGSTSNSKGEAIFVGRNNLVMNSIRRGAVAFDLAAVPLGSTVLATTVTMTTSVDRFGSSPVALHRFTADWGEGDSNSDDSGMGGGGQGAPAGSGDATWLHTFFDTDAWSDAGGDFEATASATVAVGGIGPVAWSSAALVSDVQGWLNNPSENFGWILMCDESSGGTATRFHSRQSGEVEARPQLSISFLPPPPSRAFIRGDVGTDGAADLTDAISLLEFLILGLGDLSCDDAADATDDGVVDLTDAIEILKFLILGDPPLLPAPSSCDMIGDPTPDGLGCEVYESC